MGSPVERNLVEHHRPGSQTAAAQVPAHHIQVSDRVLHALKTLPMLPPISEDFLCNFPARLPTTCRYQCVPEPCFVGDDKLGERIDPGLFGHHLRPSTLTPQ